MSAQGRFAVSLLMLIGLTVVACAWLVRLHRAETALLAASAANTIAVLGALSALWPQRPISLTWGYVLGTAVGGAVIGIVAQLLDLIQSLQDPINAVAAWLGVVLCQAMLGLLALSLLTRKNPLRSRQSNGKEAAL